MIAQKLLSLPFHDLLAYPGGKIIEHHARPNRNLGVIEIEDYLVAFARCYNEYHVRVLESGELLGDWLRTLPSDFLDALKIPDKYFVER
jgi:hypothetical protein